MTMSTLYSSHVVTQHRYRRCNPKKKCKHPRQRNITPVVKMQQIKSITETMSTTPAVTVIPATKHITHNTLQQKTIIIKYLSSLPVVLLPCNSPTTIVKAEWWWCLLWPHLAQLKGLLLVALSSLSQVSVITSSGHTASPSSSSSWLGCVPSSWCVN